MSTITPSPIAELPTTESRTGRSLTTRSVTTRSVTTRSVTTRSVTTRSFTTRSLATRFLTINVLRAVAAAATAAVAFATCTTTPAIASPASEAQPGQASFRGKTINLANGWQGAQSCVVFALTDTRCYTTHQEADDLLGYSRTTDPLYGQAVRDSAGVGIAATPACAYTWLCLYENTNGGGRRLIFRDEYWQYLSTWDFDRKTSSWRNNQGLLDQAHLSLYNLSGVYNMSANSYAANLGAYDNQAYAVWA